MSYYFRKLLKSSNKPFSVSKSFVIFILCFAALSFLIYVGLFFKHYYDIKNTIYKKLEYQSGRIENTFVDAIEYTEHSMSFIARQIVDNKKWHDHEFIRKLLISYRVPDNRIMEFSTFAWADEKHRFIISSNKGLHFDQKLYLSDRDYIPKTISHPLKMHMGKPVYGVYSKKYSIPAGYGVIDDKNKYLGAVVTSFVISGLERKFDEVISANGVGFILMQSDGLFVAGSPKINNKEILKYLSDKSSEINGKDSGVIDGVKIFGNEDFGSIHYRKIKNHPYFVFTIYDKKLERSEIDHLIFSNLVIFSLLLVLVSILLFLLYVSLVNPIITISKAAKKIAGGDNNVKLEKYRSIEVDQLARSIISIKRFVKKENILKRQLKRANKDLQNIAKSINHDLRNYVSGVAGLANLITEENDREQTIKYAHMILRQSDEILTMAQNLLGLDLAKVNIERPSQIDKFDIKELLKEIIFINRDFAKNNRVKILLNFNNDIPYVICDRVLIRRVFDNIITNAIKYSRENGEIKISASYLDLENKIVVEIADQGIGMTNDEIEMALNGQGAKIDKAGLSKIIDSHGFGLPIVKRLLDSISAKMEIESIKFKGTTVKLFFNVNDDKPKTYIENYTDRTQKGLILICDDELINRVVLDRIIKSAGYEVLTAENGEEALKLIDRNNFDLIFTDVKMPLMDGITMTKIIRSGSSFTRFKDFDKIPIIVVSSNSDEETKKEALDAGANFYLDKISGKSKIIEILNQELLKVGSQGF